MMALRTGGRYKPGDRPAARLKQLAEMETLKQEMEKEKGEKKELERKLEKTKLKRRAEVETLGQEVEKWKGEKEELVIRMKAELEEMKEKNMSIRSMERRRG